MCNYAHVHENWNISYCICITAVTPVSTSEMHQTPNCSKYRHNTLSTLAGLKSQSLTHLPMISNNVHIKIEVIWCQSWQKSTQRSASAHMLLSDNRGKR